MILILPDKFSHCTNDSLIDITHATPTIDPNLTHSNINPNLTHSNLTHFGLTSTIRVNSKINPVANQPYTDVCLWNARSLVNKLNDFSSFV